MRLTLFTRLCFLCALQQILVTATTKIINVAVAVASVVDCNRADVEISKCLRHGQRGRCKRFSIEQDLGGAAERVFFSFF